MKPKTHPLEIAARMARKAADLFRKDRRPGFALFADVGHDAVQEARGMAGSAAAEDAAALAAIDDVLADGRVDEGELDLLRYARGKIKRSGAIDEQLAAGGAA